MKWARESVEAEAYSRRLGKRIREGYAAKFRRHADQAGNAPLGFVRDAEPPHAMRTDEATIGTAVAVFRAYAAGNVADRDIAARFGLSEERVRKMLGNPLYNGWVRRHRGRDEERLPAAWRIAPPVDDELWSPVQLMRSGRRRGGGPRKPGPDLLAGLLHCVCGQHIRSDGTMGSGRATYRRRVHTGECEAWGRQRSWAADVWENPIAAQLTGMRVDDATIARVVAVLVDRSSLATNSPEVSPSRAAT